jgi:FkbM family methyltransferase
MPIQFPFKFTLRSRLPTLYFAGQRLAGKFSTTILSLRGIKLPSYFGASHRIDLLFHQCEPDIAMCVQAVVKQRDTVLDIGANVGLLSRVFANFVGPGGLVLSFEPDPCTRSFLQHNVRRLQQVRVFGFAISDKTGTANLFLNAESGTSNTLAQRSETTKTVPVECMTLDEFLRLEPLEIIDLIKIDVEGYERRVLAGMSETLKAHPETAMIIEYCPENLRLAGEIPEALLEQIAGFGFELYILHTGGSCEKVTGFQQVLAALPATGYLNLFCAKPGDQRIASLPHNQPTGRRGD